jgi:hypothetical protein
MLVVDVGVKFRTVSVKCANIFDQDCSRKDMSLGNHIMKSTAIKASQLFSTTHSVLTTRFWR